MGPRPTNVTMEPGITHTARRYLFLGKKRYDREVSTLFRRYPVGRGLLGAIAQGPARFQSPSTDTGQPILVAPRERDGKLARLPEMSAAIARPTLRDQAMRAANKRAFVLPLSWLELRPDRQARRHHRQRLVSAISTRGTRMASSSSRVAGALRHGLGRADGPWKEGDERRYRISISFLGTV